KIWETRTGRPVLLGPDTGTVVFSPDGRLLAAGGAASTRVLVVGSWELSLAIPRDDWQGWDAGVAFAPDSRLLATSRTLDRIQLFDLGARQEVCTLSAADAPFIESLCFHPDGGQLAVAGQDHTVRLWNLHALRGHLQVLGLDWEPPAEPPRALPDA